MNEIGRGGGDRTHDSVSSKWITRREDGNSASGCVMLGLELAGAVELCLFFWVMHF
jgi:hypothetical protein